jgi:hypothetical protein
MVGKTKRRKRPGSMDTGKVEASGISLNSRFYMFPDVSPNSKSSITRDEDQ